MRLLRTFKNPDDPYDSEFIDEEEVEVDEAILQDLLDNDVQVTSDSDDDAYNRDADYQFDPDSSDSSNMDDMAVVSDDPATDDNECTSSNKRAIKTKATSATSETKMDEGGGSSKKTADVAVSADDATKSTIHDLNEDDEVDETVRSIIAAIKKPRASPPEIKLDDFVTDISFHPERDYIAVATIMGDVCLYKYSNQENTLLRTIEVHAKACRDVEFSQDGSNLLTCSKDKSIMVTDMETEKLKKFYESAHDEAINKLHVIDENLFATGDDEGTVKLWDLRVKNEIFALKEVEDYIAQLLTNDEGKLLLATSGDGFLTTLSIGARKLYYQSELYEEEFTCMALYRSDSKLVVGSSKGNLYTYNWGQFTYHNYKFSGVKSSMNVMMPITDRIGCVAGEDGIIRAVHVAPFCNLGIVGQHAMPIESLDISNNGELIASSSHDNDVRFWNVKYFEDFADIKYNVKHNTYKERRHNLPSSMYSNPADFFSDLAKGTEHE